MKYYQSFIFICIASVTANIPTTKIPENLNENKNMNELITINVHELSKECRVQKINGLTIYSLIPHAAKQGWHLDLFDVTEPVDAHYHRIQTQIMIMIEGKLELTLDDKRIVMLPGQTIKIAPGTVHGLTPIDGPARSLFIDFPGFNYPEDAYSDKQLPNASATITVPSSSELLFDTSVPLSDTLIQQLQRLNSFEPEYYTAKYNKGSYSAYDLIAGKKTWDVALLEITDSPTHYHKFGKEIFVVMNGELAIQVEGAKYVLKAGDLVHIPPHKVHHLKSAKNTEAVRVLCISVPAFDPNDMYIV